MQTDPVSQESASASPPYRHPAAPSCARCGESLRDGFLFSPTTGASLCEGCHKRELIEAANITVKKSGGARVVHERRCSRCGGVASAGKVTLHERQVSWLVNGLPVHRDRVQNGGDTEFRCESCGHGFTLHNSVRTMRLSQIALLVMLPGTLGVLALAGYTQRETGNPTLGSIAAVTAFVLLVLLCFSPLIRDAKLRLQHPPRR